MRRTSPSPDDGSLNLEPIAYSLQFRGTVEALSPHVLVTRATAPSQRLVTVIGEGGLAGGFEPSSGGGEAVLESRLVLTDERSFEESGTITFAHGHVVRFRSLGSGRLVRCPDPHLRHGAAIWEVENGEGQFEGAHGRITSNFLVSDTGELTDNHFGLIFTARAVGAAQPLGFRA